MNGQFTMFAWLAGFSGPVGQASPGSYISKQITNPHGSENSFQGYYKSNHESTWIQREAVVALKGNHGSHFADMSAPTTIPTESDATKPNMFALRAGHPRSRER